MGMAVVGTPQQHCLAIKWSDKFGTRNQMLAMSMHTFLDFAEKFSNLGPLNADFEYTPPVKIQVENGTKTGIKTKESVTIPKWVLAEIEEGVDTIAADVTKTMIDKRDSVTRFKQMLQESGVAEDAIERIMQKTGAEPGAGTLQ